MRSLDGVTMFVSSTAANGVVGSATRLHFVQRGSRVAARYGGGNVARGWLAGTIAGDRLVFRYVQRELSGAIHNGRSVGLVEPRGDGRVRIVEHFTWSSRAGSGTNVFDELPPDGSA
ncbi:MAG TPA: hypothetical protein VIG08_11275 [Gemmatimonadales bacterium]|jgi:hypothetical protein